MGFVKKFFGQGVKLFVYDYAGIYCPVSWKVARHYRLAEMRKFLGVEGRQHANLGLIYASDCDVPSKQEQIAVYCFWSRKKFWFNALKNFLISPILGAVTIVYFFVYKTLPVTFNQEEC